jgi:hypothetical protein
MYLDTDLRLKEEALSEGDAVGRADGSAPD